MSEPKIQFVLTVERAQTGDLLALALTLNAHIDSIGLVTGIPYQKNKPKAETLLALTDATKKLGRPKLPPGTPSHKQKAAAMSPTEKAHEIARAARAREAVKGALILAGSKGMLYVDGKEVYQKNDGKLQGYGPMLRMIAIVKGDRIFLKPEEKK